MNDKNLAIMIILIIVGAAAIIISLAVASNIEREWERSHYIFGDDTESDLGLCLRHFQAYCDKVDIEKTMNDLLNRTREWNNNKCGTPRVIDEVYCITGKHDPDWNDTGEGN